MMQKTTIACGLMIAVAGTAMADGPVQWSVEDGGNGHWYELVENNPNRCWLEAQAHAETLGGELASLETITEFEFAKTIVYGGSAPYSTMIGLLQDEDGVEPAGGWRWLSGEPLEYDEWASTLDDAAGCQDWASFADGSGYGKLDDIYPCEGCVHESYEPRMLVEWSADCNGDGIVDYGQILNGTFTDANANGVPDCCEDGSCLNTIQWRIEDGGNGHWYQLVETKEGFLWSEAVAEAASRGGYLVSLTSADEDAWVYANFDAYDRWIGALQDTNAADYSEPSGGWGWLSGEPLGYSNWNGGSADNGGVADVPEEEYAHYCCGGAWNDIYGVDSFGVLTRKQMMVEYTVLPGMPVGACCLDGLCITSTASDCVGVGGSWGGPNSSCTDFACPVACPGDIDGDGDVDGADLSHLLGAWGLCF